MNIDTKLNELFNIKPDEVATPVEIFKENEVIEIDVPIDEPEVESNGDEVDEDFKTARVILKNLILTNNVAIDQIGKIAITYENPRGFEVLGQLIRAQSDLVKELMQSHKLKQDLSGKKPDLNQHVETQNNIVFSGTPSELLKEISKQNGK